VLCDADRNGFLNQEEVIDVVILFLMLGTDKKVTQQEKVEKFLNELKTSLKKPFNGKRETSECEKKSCRYINIDDIFMIYNKSEKELIKHLDEENTCHPNIKLDYQIDKSLPSLDVLFMNNNGILSKSVYHKQSVEPYIVPFISDHPRHVFRNIVQTVVAIYYVVSGDRNERDQVFGM
jgi:hypothetical protein